MNTTSENIIMTIEFNLPESISNEELTQVELGTPVAPRLETQVSADIDWTSWPYCLSFPVVAPRLETQVSTEIDWTSWPYCLSFPEVSGVCKL